MRVVRRGGVTLYDYAPKQDFAADVLAGLRADPPIIPSKYFYDKRGSELFEQICELPEYYVTRTELAIMQGHVGEMAAALGPRCAVVEPGAGSGLKTRLLLAALDDPVAYVPLDISRKFLLQTAATLAEEFPTLEIAPVCADYLGDWEIPPLSRYARRNVAYFPGSTIGNMEPPEAVALLRKLAAVCCCSRQSERTVPAAIRPRAASRRSGPAAIKVQQQSAEVGILIGVDLRKDASVIRAAYDDSAGVTRAFNLNLIDRLNRELGAGIPAGAIEHSTTYNEAAGRNESYLVVTAPLHLTLAGETIDLPAGTHILVEHSYKYSLEGFAQLAAEAGLAVQRVWMDERQWFSVQYLTAA